MEKKDITEGVSVEMALKKSDSEIGEKEVFIL